MTKCLIKHRDNFTIVIIYEIKITSLFLCGPYGIQRLLPAMNVKRGGTPGPSHSNRSNDRKHKAVMDSNTAEVKRKDPPNEKLTVHLAIYVLQ
jgi:hypothetical protein